MGTTATAPYERFSYNEFRQLLLSQSLGTLEFGNEEPVIYRPYTIDSVTIKNGKAKVILSYESSKRRGKKRTTVILKLNQEVTELNLPYLATNLANESLRIEPVSTESNAHCTVGNRYTVQIGQEYLRFCHESR
jgi:hypothetical protein